MPNNFFEYPVTKDLNVFIREYGQANLSNDTPAAPDGNTNITWQTDSLGNLSAHVPNAFLPFTPRGTWASGSTYNVGDLVLFDGSSYLSLISNNVGNQPDTSPSDWQLIAQAGGGSNLGDATQIAFYATTGNTVSATNLVSTGNNLTVPGLLSSDQEQSEQNITVDRTPSNADYTQRETDLNVWGSGFNLGNDGGWSTSKGQNNSVQAAQRGIDQVYGGAVVKHAIGDTAGVYVYVKSDGGLSASSDEGVTGATFQSLENQGYFFGTVASTSGAGDQAPVLTHTSGNNWTTDGAFLLNITKGTISGNLTGSSTTLNLNIGDGVVPTYLNRLPVSATLPLSTAIGIVTAAIPNPAVSANNPQATSIVVNLAQIGGIYKPFTQNSVVTVAGNQYPEQSILTSVSGVTTVGPHQQQTLNLKLRNPNSQAIVFQGGIQGQYISFDANLIYSGMRSSYFALGSTNGSDLIYAVQNSGGVVNNLLPMTGSEVATTTGPASGFHLYPGAEIVANTSLAANPTLEQNGVSWSVSDVVENPHFPIYGGNALFINRYQQTPSAPSTGSTGLLLAMDGPGLGGGNTSAIRVINGWPSNQYVGAGGSAATAPILFDAQGAFGGLLYFNQVPDTGDVIHIVNNPNNRDQLFVVDLNWTANGGLYFTNSTGRWTFTGAVDAQNGLFVNHVPGVDGTFTSQDGKTVTVSKGLIIGIV